MRILLVEDERKVASFIARALKENTYAVDTVETGKRRLKLAQRSPMTPSFWMFGFPVSAESKSVARSANAESKLPFLCSRLAVSSSKGWRGWTRVQTTT